MTQLNFILVVKPNSNIESNSTKLSYNHPKPNQILILKFEFGIYDLKRYPLHIIPSQMTSHLASPFV